MKHQHPPDTSRRRLLAALAGLPAGALLVAADCNAVTTPPPRVDHVDDGHSDDGDTDDGCAPRLVDPAGGQFRR